MTSATNVGATSEDFRRVMSCFATGVAVVTTEMNGMRFGMTVNSLTSVSPDPVVLLVCLAQESTTASALLRRGRFVVNLLTADQEAISRRFVGKTGDRFQGVRLVECDDGLPAVEGALGHIVCCVTSTQDVGDHVVVFGRVLACQASEGASSLLPSRLPSFAGLMAALQCLWNSPLADKVWCHMMPPRGWHR